MAGLFVLGPIFQYEGLFFLGCGWQWLALDDGPLDAGIAAILIDDPVLT